MLPDWFWERHSNPFSAWSRMLSYPLVFFPFWYHSLLGAIPVVIWFALNPLIFPKPQSTDNWASKAVLGEKLWVKKKRGMPLFLAVATAPFFIVSIYTAYKQMFWPTMFFGGMAFMLKVWFCDRVVVLYERVLTNAEQN